MSEMLHEHEEWRPVGGKYTGLPYEVSSHGNARSVDRISKSGVRKGRVLKQKYQRGPGYFCVGICSGGKRGENIRVHKLVTETFLGPCPAGLCVNHKDANKLNNHISNLEYATQSRNVRHAMEHGLFNFVSARLTDELVRKIRSDYTDGRVATRTLAKKYRVGKSTVHAVTSMQTWKHVQ
jgi:hypothetical protein